MFLVFIQFIKSIIGNLTVLLSNFEQVDKKDLEDEELLVLCSLIFSTMAHLQKEHWWNEIGNFLQGKWSRKEEFSLPLYQ